MAYRKIEKDIASRLGVSPAGLDWLARAVRPGYEDAVTNGGGMAAIALERKGFAKREPRVLPANARHGEVNYQVWTITDAGRAIAVQARKEGW